MTMPKVSDVEDPAKRQALQGLVECLVQQEDPGSGRSFIEQQPLEVLAQFIISLHEKTKALQAEADRIATMKWSAQCKMSRLLREQTPGNPEDEPFHFTAVSRQGRYLFRIDSSAPEGLMVYPVIEIK